MNFSRYLIFLALHVAVTLGLLNVGYNDTHVWMYNITHSILYSYDNTIPGSLMLWTVEKEGFPDRLVRSDKAEIWDLADFLIRRASNSSTLIGNEETTECSPVRPIVMRHGSDQEFLGRNV